MLDGGQFPGSVVAVRGCAGVIFRIWHVHQFVMLSGTSLRRALAVRGLPADPREVSGVDQAAEVVDQRRGECAIVQHHADLDVLGHAARCEV